jgi:predicted membrane-bound spermidine synthase
VSGFAALLYQSVWQRLLTFFSGADVFSITLIVSAFMGGLGFGSLAGGQLADRLAFRRRIVAFALSELAISLFAFVSVFLLYDTLYLRLGQRALPLPAVAAVLFLTLLWPTFFMGLSLPLLSRAFTDSTEVAAPRIGSLYGWNTLGAAVGALVTVWVLARAIGFEASLRVGAVLNLVCALAALALLPRRTTPTTEDTAPIEDERSPPPTWGGTGWAVDERRAAATTQGPAFWTIVYALSGFVALGLEILWFRLLGTIHKPSSFTFSTLLAIFLAGVGGGALLGTRAARRSRRPASTFLLLQAGIGLYAGLSLAILVAAVDRVSWLHPLWEYLGQYETLDLDDAIRSAFRWLRAAGEIAPYAQKLAGQLVLLYVAVPLLVIGPPTLLMGLSYPFLQRAVQTDLALLGRRVGRLQTANIVGSMLGSALTGLVLLHALGTPGTLRFLMIASGVFLLLWGALHLPPRRRLVGLALAAVVVAAAVAAVPRAPVLWAKLHGTRPERILFGEDGSGLSVLKEEEGQTVVYVDGLGQSQLPYGGYHTFLGTLPVLLHARPERVMAIGLGSGDTLFGLGARRETVRLDCAEIVRPQLETLRLLGRQQRYGGLDVLLRDERVRFAFTDGRSFLLRSPERFDVIEADALRPGTPYVGNLYSYEYFVLLRQRLRPGGLGVTWAPTARVKGAFLKAFPHALQFGDTMLGSNEPIAYDREALRARMSDPFTQSRFQRAGIDLDFLMGPALNHAPVVTGPETDRSALVEIDTDLFPRDEYLTTQMFWPGKTAEDAARPSARPRTH